MISSSFCPRMCSAWLSKLREVIWVKGQGGMPHKQVWVKGQGGMPHKQVGVSDAPLWMEDEKLSSLRSALFCSSSLRKNGALFVWGLTKYWVLCWWKWFMKGRSMRGTDSLSSSYLFLLADRLVNWLLDELNCWLAEFAGWLEWLICLIDNLI